MNIILTQIENIFDIFNNVTEVFSGNYSGKGVEISKMRYQLENESIPTIGNDRKNLKDDSSKVVEDYKKALEYKKSELKNG